MSLLWQFSPICCVYLFTTIHSTCLDLFTYTTLSYTFAMIITYWPMITLFVISQIENQVLCIDCVTFANFYFAK